MYIHTILAISTGKSSLTGRAPICGFGWFGSSPKFYPLYKIYSYKGVYIIIIGLELEFNSNSNKIIIINNRLLNRSNK